MNTENKKLNHAIMLATAELEKIALNPFKATGKDIQLYYHLMEYMDIHNLKADYYEWYAEDEFVSKE